MEARKYVERAYASILNHDFEKAIEWFEQAIQIEPDNASVQYKISITYARNNKLSKAMEHAAEAVRLEPDNETYRYHRSHLQARELMGQAGRYMEQRNADPHMAIACLKNAIKEDPLLKEAYVMLGMAHASLGDYHQAISAIQEAVRLDPADESKRLLLDKIRGQLVEQLGGDTSSH
jgi:tetratricopeptide (TPR) repeat protein